MSHLTTETIARLVDEPPTELEAAHLAECEPCRAEFAALRDDVRALATLPDLAPAPDAWDTLARRLAGEGIMLPGRRTPARFRPWLQAAAAVVLFAGGLAAGRELGAAAGSSTQPAGGRVPDIGAVTPAPRAPAADAGPAVAEAEAAERPAVTGATAASPTMALASSDAPARAAPPRTMDEAAALLRQTEELYLGALTRYAELATDADAGDPVARLAALQSIVMTTQAALTQTPADPVINGYHLTAVAQRDATLRQVAATTSERWY
jgi:hypothetical protein